MHLRRKASALQATLLPHPQTPMKNKQNNFLRASALQITLVSISAVLLTLGAAPARNQIQQKSAAADATAQDPQRCAAASESVVGKRSDARKSAQVEFSASRERVGGNEITGCGARRAQAAVVSGETPVAPIPFKDIGAKATADYHGDAIGIDPVAEGARVRTAFQKLSGSISRDGLWLKSTEAEGGQLHLIASAIGKAKLQSRGTVAIRGNVVS